MSVVVEVIASNYLDQYFEVHCEYTKYDRDEQSQPEGGVSKSPIFAAPFCQHHGLQAIITEDDDAISVDLKIMTHTSVKSTHVVYIVKCNGSKVNITDDIHYISEHDANVYVREENKLYFRFEIDIVSDISREHLGMLKLFDSIDDHPSDFEIQAKDGILKVSKNILIVKWNYFATMMNSNCAEQLNNIWIVDDFGVDLMRAIIGFVYCDAITFEDADHAMKLVEAGHRYLLDDLLFDCMKYLGAELNVENVLHMLLLSDMYDLPILKEKSLILLPKALKGRDMKDMPGYEEFSKYKNRAPLIEACLEKTVNSKNVKRKVRMCLYRNRYLE
ncbi:Protein maternal effect lethal 26 [Halotydeus destructor]|nr:Protein maternal effect lethal 26 [Halotydeus destructor]